MGALYVVIWEPCMWLSYVYTSWSIIVCREEQVQAPLKDMSVEEALSTTWEQLANLINSTREMEGKESSV